MYKLIRNIHLLLGLSAAFFILVYGVSAVQMAHQFAIRPHISTAEVKLRPGLTGREAAQILMDRYGYRGDLSGSQAAGANLQFTMTRPGGADLVTYAASTGNARVERRELPLLGFLNRLHHLHGTDHTDMAMNAWAWILGWISVTLILLGATGVYMWFRLYNERVIGSILLGVNLCVSIGLLALLRR